MPDAHVHDMERTRFLESNGIKVIRFHNEEIENDMDEVLRQIRQTVKDIRPRPDTIP